MNNHLYARIYIYTCISVPITVRVLMLLKGDPPAAPSSTPKRNQLNKNKKNQTGPHTNHHMHVCVTPIRSSFTSLLFAHAYRTTKKNL